MNQRNLLEVDWSKIPAPVDDGGTAHSRLCPPYILSNSVN